MSIDMTTEHVRWAAKDNSIFAMVSKKREVDLKLCRENGSNSTLGTLMVISTS
ncbi:hypothetical protein QBE52_17525 [Clostridiaceae bacterium 35-E11]